MYTHMYSLATQSLPKLLTHSDLSRAESGGVAGAGATPPNVTKSSDSVTSTSTSSQSTTSTLPPLTRRVCVYVCVHVCVCFEYSAIQILNTLLSASLTRLFQHHGCVCCVHSISLSFTRVSYRKATHPPHPPHPLTACAAAALGSDASRCTPAPSTTP